MATKQKTVLVLRSCKADMTSKNGFVWPKAGPVECADWNPKPECGNGLHGLSLGQQDPGVWLEELCQVVRVAEGDIVDLRGKVKFPKGVVVYTGDIAGASAYFAENGGAEGLYRRMASGGYGSTLTGGNDSTLTGGDDSTLTGGDDSTLTGGNYSTLTGGDYSTLTGGNDSTLAARWWDGGRCRMRVHYVGEDGIKANTAYRCEKGELVEVQA